jgi:hypothetical protein
MEIFMESSLLRKNINIYAFYPETQEEQTVEPELPDEEDGDISCSICVFWNQDEENPEVGECRRNPPAVVVVHDEECTLVPTSLFPVTADAEWCGEYQAG